MAGAGAVRVAEVVAQVQLPGRRELCGSTGVADELGSAVGDVLLAEDAAEELGDIAVPGIRPHALAKEAETTTVMHQASTERRGSLQKYVADSHGRTIMADRLSVAGAGWRQLRGTLVPRCPHVLSQLLCEPVDAYRNG